MTTVRNIVTHSSRNAISAAIGVHMEQRKILRFFPSNSFNKVSNLQNENERNKNKTNKQMKRWVIEV